MKLNINLGNKTLKDKNLLNKLAEHLDLLNDNLFENNIPENLISNKEGIREKTTGNMIKHNPSSEAMREEYTYDTNQEENSFLYRYLAAAGNIIKQTNKTSYAGYNTQSQQNTNSTREKSISFRENPFKERLKTNSNTGNDFDKVIDSMDTKVLSFTESAGNSFKKMWDDLVKKGRKAKDPWDAVWTSLRDSAMKRIGEILKTELFNDLFTRIAGGGSSNSFLGSIISGIAGFFTGGVLSKTGTEMISSNANPAAAAFNNSSYYTNRELVSTFSRYADAAEKWQRELRVVNDLFENNRGIKTVQEYLNKIKS